MITKTSILILSILILVSSCDNGDPVMVVEGASIPIPQNFPEMNPQSFEITDGGIALGRKLFFDPKLSSNQEVSCGSCHQQEYAFAENIDLSTEGVSSKKLDRNSPVLFNLGWQNNFFWDGGSNNLESQVYGPLTHEDEMGNDLVNILDYINNAKDYTPFISNAFDTTALNSQMLAFAISQYELTLVSANSNYDKYIRHEGYSLTPNELEGKFIYDENCSSCHASDLFSDYDFHNNGLDTIRNDYTYDDPLLGRFRISLDSADILKYKTPSLRNIKVSAPYMHDGRFKTIEDVIEHYSTGIVISETLDSLLPTSGFNFTEDEKHNLKAFLLTLTDLEFIHETP